ncbi:RNA-binding protein 7 [Discoglossus pictus]
MRVDATALKCGTVKAHILFWSSVVLVQCKIMEPLRAAHLLLHVSVSGETSSDCVLLTMAGPAISVKIPKDKDGKPKQFAFVNFKHEESVPYGMNLLNGIKLFGRPLKIQFRSGSSHASQDANVAHNSPQGNGNGRSANSSPSSTNGSRYDNNGDPMKSRGYSPSTQNVQRSFSFPDNIQRQAVVNSYLLQQSQYGASAQIMVQSGFSSSPESYYNQYGQSSNHSTPSRYDSMSSQHKNRSPHPYHPEGHRYSRESPYRGSPEDRSGDRSHESRSHDYDQRRDNRWRSSRH